jgi:hypothetical protein
MVSKQAEAYFDYLYNFSFQKADSCLMHLNGIPAYYKQFLLLNTSWWKLISTDDQKYITEGYINIIQGLNLIEHAEMNENEKTFLKICFESFRLRLLLYNQQYLRSYSQTKVLNKLTFPLLGKEKLYPPLNLTSGLYNYFAYMGNKKYPFLINDKNYKTASRVLGLEFLNQCSMNENIMLHIEARYFLMKINLEMEEDGPKALEYSTSLIKDYKGNLIFQYYHLKILLHLKNELAAKEQYNKILRLTHENNELSEMQKKHMAQITAKLYNNRK